MRRPVIARKATTPMTRNSAGIIGQQVYLSCARCNAKRAGLSLFRRGGAGACQPGFTANGGVAMNHSALGCLIDRRNKRVEIDSLGIGSACALVQRANATQNP